MEILEALENYRTDKITKLLNEMYEPRQIPPDITKSIIIALSKENKDNTCEWNRINSFMIHITKIL